MNMSKIISYILISSVLLQNLQITGGDNKGYKIFISDAIEHLQMGDSLISFIQKHYGSKETIKNHIKKEHPERDKKDKHHHSDNFHVWSLAGFQDLNIKPILLKKDLPEFYKGSILCVFLKPLYSPPELI